MKIITTIIAVFISVSLTYSQKEISKVEKFSKKVLQNVSKGNIWVMDTMKSYTGQGSTEWDFDYTEIVRARNSRGLPTLIETIEKVEGTASWRNRYHAEISYFNNDTVAEYKLNEWNISTNSWVPDYSYYETKDEDGKILIHYSRSWSDEYASFTQGNKEIYTYNGELTSIKEDKDWNNSTWEDYAKTYYYHDLNNNDTLELQKRFISEENWRDNWKTKFTYNENNQKIMEEQWGYDSYWDEWYDYSKTTISYYDNGLLDNGLLKDEYTERFDYDNSEWYDLSKTKYFYNAKNLLDYKEELDLQDPGNNLKYVYTYNENNQETSFFLYDWNGSDWTLFYKVFDNYDVNGNQTDYYSQVSDGTWQNYLKEEYTWNEFYVNINNLYYSDITIFPNPAYNFLTIKNSLSEKYKIEIFDISGKQIFATNSEKRIFKLNISSYPAGTYFVNIVNTKGKKSFKFLKK